MINLIKKKILRNKMNYVMIIIFTICSFALMGTLMFEKNYMQMQRDDFDKNVQGRTLLVSPTASVLDELLEQEDGFKNYEYDYDSILSIDHVQAAYPSNYENGGETTFKSDLYDGQVNLIYGNEFTLPNNIKGERFTGDDTGVAICPFKFYPDSNDITIDTKYIDGDSLLDTTFDLTYRIYNNDREALNKTRTFKIIGLYDNTIINQLPNTCFVSGNDLSQMYEEGLGLLNEDLLMSIEVVVDDIKNLSTVKDELKKLNLKYTDKLVIDIDAVNNLKIITHTCIIFVIIAIIGVSITFIKKRNILNSKEIGLYSSLGFSNQYILYIYTFELCVLTSIAYLVSIVLIGIFYAVITKVFANLFLSLMYTPKLFVSRYLWGFIVVIIFPLIVNNIFILKAFKNSDNYLMKEVE